ncbi:MAG: hypothetical protein D6689_10665 [Deltaproteobacteria bacterium]|nr:MAG: hypothetical protein D6689_10665 [Deltaproteobacteria bacterium]
MRHTRPAVTTARQPLWIAHLRGTQEQMGEQHGALLRAHGGWRAALAFYPELADRMLFRRARPRPARAAGRALVAAMLAELSRHRPGDYRRRSRAFMRALGLPAADARSLGVMDALQNCIDLAGRLRLGPFARDLASRMPPACSTLMVWGAASVDGALRHARNFDFPGIGVWDAAPAVVFCDPDDGLRYGFVTTRGADAVGVTAFNEAGISVTAHTRFHRQCHVSGALVVDVGHDIVRRAESIADAVRLVRRRPVASTWGLAVSSARERRAVVIETAGARVAVVEPTRDGMLACANRYRHPDMLAGQLTLTPCWAYHSDERQARLEALAAAARARGGMTDADLRAALGDDVLAQAATVQSVVIEPEARRVWVATGGCPTSWGPWMAVPWSWDEPVGAHAAAAGDGDRRTDEAFAAYVEATRIDADTHDDASALAAIERAVSLAPDRPDFRFLAGVLELRFGRLDRALAHFDAGLAHERRAFRRGQLLLWAARTAAARGDAARAAALRDELCALDHPLLARHRGAARFERERPARATLRPPVPNFLLVDAL